ncbi:MAG: hypothetical protein MUC88_16550 [Planctomycetes bacterium]|jgi:hypothetical protein|nr:hypothetical protein [Planctomycetota bacterium]
MNLMKWLRKNNKKIMAIVVIVLMVAFIGGSSFQYLFRGSGGAKDAIAYFGPAGKQKITHLDRMAAEQEINILNALGGDNIARAQGLGGLLMSDLVFRQNRSAAVLEMARQTIQRNRYRISDKQLAETSNLEGVPTDMYWILLCEEARAAGIHVSDDEVGQLLERLIPQLFDKRTYREVIPAMMQRLNVPEERIVATFGKLLSVLQYSQVIATMESLTGSQIKHMASGEAESLSADFVQFKAAYFTDKDEKPADEAVAEQFHRYKTFFPGDVNEANPFGFGYRLPDRVRFDYIALKLSDVVAVAKAPTEEEAEQYYQDNREQQFTERKPSDPNDPNSKPVETVKSYAEVAGTIMNQLRRERVLTKAEQILQEARTQADTGLQTANFGGQEPTLEQRMRQAGDYMKIAEELGKKHGLALYSGRTGSLSAINVQNDKHLRRMYLMNSGYNPMPLSQLLFSVKELGEHATVLFSMPPAEMYLSVGPARDPMAATATDMTGQIMMIARVVEVEKNAPPTGPDMVYSTKTLGLGEPADAKNETFFVGEQVANDVKAVDAWDLTKTRAQEFMALTAKDGWDKAIAQFNQLYGKQAATDPNDPNVFRLDQQMGLQRIAKADLEVLATQVASSPASQIVLNQAADEGRFVNRLYSLIPPKSNAPAQFPLLVDYQPHQSYYVLKDLSVQRVTQEDFQKRKGMIVRREEYNQVETLSAVHFHPGNILKRMNFRFAHPTDEPTEEQPPDKAKEAS